MKQEFVIELINCTTKDSIILLIDGTDISIEAMKQWIIQQKTTWSCKQHLLHIIGNDTCDLEIEDIFTLCKIIQTAISEPLSWGIIEKVLCEKDDNLVASLLLY